MKSKEKLLLWHIFLSSVFLKGLIISSYTITFQVTFLAFRCENNNFEMEFVLSLEVQDKVTGMF